MKAKRQILSLLLALVMVWQGFSFANAAGSNQDGINLENKAVEIASSTEEKREEAPNVELTENGSKEETNRVAEEANEANDEDGFDDLAMLEELSKNFSEEDLNALIAASAVEVSDAPKAIDGVLSNYKLTIDGADVQDGTTVPSYKTLQFQADIHIDSSKNVKKDDYSLKAVSSLSPVRMIQVSPLPWQRESMMREVRRLRLPLLRKLKTIPQLPEMYTLLQV